MTFTVRYRDNTGAIRQIQVEAANRVACMAECRHRGIVPSSVREAGKNKGRKTPGDSKGVGYFHGKAVVYVFSAIGILLIGMGLWSSFMGSSTQPSKRKESMKQSPRKHNPFVTDRGIRQLKTSGVTAPVTNTAPMILDPQTNWPYMWRGQKIVSIDRCYTNMGKEVNYFTTSDGKQRCFERIAYTPIFENATDDLISQAINADPDAVMPPMPMMQSLDKEFLASLAKPIVINPEDSEQVRKTKEAVIQARKDMKRMMDQGMTFNEILQEHRKLANENLETRRQLATDVRQLIDAGEDEEARKYLQEVNPALKEMGLAPLEMPLSHEEIMERRLENRRKMQKRAEVGASGK